MLILNVGVIKLRNPVGIMTEQTPTEINFQWTLS